MGWFDDFGAGTYQSKTSTVLNVGQIYYDKKFLSIAKNVLKLIPFGQRRPIPMAAGIQIQFNRWLNLSNSVSSATLTEGVNPNATQAFGQKLNASLKEYGAFIQVSSLLTQSHIDKKINGEIAGLVEILGEHSMNIMDLLCHMEVLSNGAIPITADQATTSTYTGTFTTVTSTTSMADTALASNTDYGDANDDINQSLLTITNGIAQGQQRAVTDYVTSGGVITVSAALDIAPEVGDAFTVTTPDEITTGDDLSYSNIKAARVGLKNDKAPQFGGHYILLVSPFMASQLMDDTNWINIHTYKDQTMGIFEGEIGKFLGCRVIEESNEFRFPVQTRGTAGTSGGPGAGGDNYAVTGAVGAALMLGRDAFGVTTFKNKNGKIQKPPIIIKHPSYGDTSNPLNRYGTVGWAMEAVYKALDPRYARQIWVDAS